MDINEYVLNILKTYPSMLQKMKCLEFEIKSFTFPLLSSDTIEAATLGGRGLEERVNSGGGHADQTAELAIRHMDAQRSSVYMVLLTRLDRLRVVRLVRYQRRYCMDLLDQCD